MTLKAMQLVVTNPGKKAPFVSRGNIKIYRLGHCWWQYGDFCGDLMYVRFLNQIFFAPDEHVTAFGYALESDVEGMWYKLYNQLDAFDPKILGEAINLAAARLGGLKNIGISGFEGPPPKLTKIGSNQRLLTATK
jgi:hypothetical protein